MGPFDHLGDTVAPRPSLRSTACGASPARRSYAPPSPGAGPSAAARWSGGRNRLVRALRLTTPWLKRESVAVDTQDTRCQQLTPGMTVEIVRCPALPFLRCFLGSLLSSAQTLQNLRRQQLAPPLSFFRRCGALLLGRRRIVFECCAVQNPRSDWSICAAVAVAT